MRWRLAALIGEDIDLANLPAPMRDPETEARAHELSAALADVLERLSTDEKLLLTLKYEDELPARRIAAAAGLPTQWHVYRRMNALLRRLRQELMARGFDSPTP